MANAFFDKINLIKKWKGLPKSTRNNVVDKITTGILIFLFSTPVLVLLYIILWFIFRN